MTVPALLLSIIISSGSLGWGFYAVGLVSFSTWILIFGAIWLLAIKQNWDWFSSIGLLLVVILAAFGLWIKLPPGWMFSGGIFALFAWDMNDYRARLRFVVKNSHTRRMEQIHIAKVSLLALMGMSFATLSMLVRAGITPEWMALLGVVMLLGLTQIARGIFWSG